MALSNDRPATIFFSLPSSSSSSSLTISGTLANSGNVQIGPNNLTLSGPTTASLGSLTNASGANFLLFGSAGQAAIANVTGATKNSGTIGVAEAKMTFVGQVTNNGSGTGLLDLGNAGNITLDNGSDSNTVVDFQTSNGLLSLQKPLNFAGTIEQFVLGDRIDLLKTIATGDSFSAGVLTVSNGGTAVAHLRFAGAYTTSSFSLTSDGNGGTFVSHT